MLDELQPTPDQPDVEAVPKPKRGRKPGTTVKPANSQLSTDDTIALIKQLVESLTDKQDARMVELVRELKKPTDLQQQAEDEKNALIKRRNEEGLKLAQIEEQRKAYAKANCTHAMPGRDGAPGKHLWRAQVNSDGYFRPLCTGCLTVLAPIKATQFMLQNGCELHRYPSLNVEVLEAWAKRSEAENQPLAVGA